LSYKILSYTILSSTSFVPRSFVLNSICPPYHLSSASFVLYVIDHSHYLNFLPWISFVLNSLLSCTSILLHIISLKHQCPSLHFLHIICPAHFLSYTSFVLHIIFPTHHLSCTSFFLHIICPSHHLSCTSFSCISFVLHFICPTHHLSYTSFVLHIICPAYHFTCTSFFLHIICPSHHFSCTLFVLRLICPTSLVINIIYPTHYWSYTSMNYLHEYHLSYILFVLHIMMGKSLVRFFKTFKGFVLSIGSTQVLELFTLKIWTLRNNICKKRSEKRSKNDPKKRSLKNICVWKHRNYRIHIFP